MRNYKAADRSASSVRRATGGTTVPEPALLALQRQIGNAAVARLLAADDPASVAVQRSATTDVGSWLGDRPKDATYELALAVDAPGFPDPGHAWIELKEQSADRHRFVRIGFWPAALTEELPWTAILSAPWGPGELQSPDRHAGGPTARSSQIIDVNGLRRVLNVIKKWEGRSYSLLLQNCAHFAREATNAGNPYSSTDGIESMGPQIWMPGELADGIEDSEKQAKDHRGAASAPGSR